MANTKIRLKSSGVTGNIPSSLQFGELALNYADGKLFFKRANNQISSFDLDLVGIQPDSFATINSDSTLILATSPTDTLSIVAGNNVSISTNSSSKTITINALSDDIDQIVRDIANTIAANTVYTQGVDAAQNTRINAAFAAANVGNTFVSSGGTVTGNVTITGTLTVGDDFIIEGNTTYTNTNSLQIDNPIIFLANNNVLGDTFDIGFVGLYNNGANSYTGLFRDPNLDEYFLFRDYTQTVQANTLININDASFIKANLIAGYIKANLISETATVAGVNILDFLNQISSNTVYNRGVDLHQNNVIQTVFSVANTASANTVYTQGVDAYQNNIISSTTTRLNAAFAAANVGNNFVNNGGTINGDVSITEDLTVTGNLTVLGTEVTLNTASIDIDASLLLLANNNTLSDAIDFGFVGTYNDGTVRKAGLFRDPNLKEFLFFDGYTPGVTSNSLIDLNDSSFSRANIQADYFKGNLIATSVIVNGIDLTDKLNSLTSNTIYTQGVDTWQNTRIAAVDSYADGAYTQAIAANNLAQSAFNKANNAIDQYSRDTANSASSNTVYTQGVDATQNTRITAVDSYAGGAYTQANAANNLAQSAFNKANTNAADIAVIQGVDTTQNTRIQAAFDKANNASPMLKVASIDSSNVYSNIVSNVSTIAFDTFTGFHVYDMGEGNVKISLGSTFSTWNVVGQGDLNAVGDDIIRINGANGIVITTNPSDTPYKSITFNGKTIFDKANSAYNMAEAADILASKLAEVNITQNTYIQASFDKANSANVLAQAAFNKANTGGEYAIDNVARLTANSASANTIYTQGVDTWQNTRIIAINSYANSSYAQANLAYAVASDALSVWSPTATLAQNAYDKANSANSLAQAAFNAANNINVGSSVDQYARNTANSASSNTIIIQGVDNTQNTRLDAINNYSFGAYAQANSANVLAQASFNTANTKLNSSGGTISGDLTVTGNLFVSGNTTTYTSNNVVINDPIILLANNNTGNALDIGFVAHYIESDTLKHTGLIKDVSTNTWYLLDNYTPEIQGTNLLDPNHASLRISTLKANLISNSVFINGYDVLAYTQAAFNQANTGGGGGVVSLGGFAPNNVLTVNSAGYIANNANLNYYTSNNTLVVTGNVVGGGIRSTSSATAPLNPVVGDIWYKTTTDVMYRYTSDGTNAYWLDITGSSVRLDTGIISAGGIKVTDTFIATANQTTFTTSQGYDVNALDVYYNGVKLIKDSDYTASDGLTVVLTSPATAYATIQLVAWSSPINILSPFLLMGA